MNTTKQREWPSYRTVWRWHFWAGLFCIPFVIFLSITGTIYLFKPQVESWMDRSYDSLAAIEEHRPLSEQVRAVLDEHPDAKTVQVELPRADQGATRVVVKDKQGTWKVFIHPQTLQIMTVRDEDAALMKRIKSLHGQLGIGTWGSYLVELAACWTIVMILTGLALWWPTNAKGFGGVLYPRWNKSNQVWRRDLHSVLGFWISLFAVFLILTGLPWAKFWGSYFRSVRDATGLASISQDWTLGGKQPQAASEHSHHEGPSKPSATRKGGRSGGAPIPKDLGGFDILLSVARKERLAYPVLLSPPEAGSSHWRLSSDAQNRPLRQTILIDGATAEIVSREGYSTKHWIDRMVGVGIAAHEGQLFGIPNQLLGLLTTSGLIALASSGVWMWYKRREVGTWGIPEPLRHGPIVWTVWWIILALGIAMPLFGGSAVIVLLMERWVLSARIHRKPKREDSWGNEL